MYVYYVTTRCDEAIKTALGIEIPQLHPYGEARSLGHHHANGTRSNGARNVS